MRQQLEYMIANQIEFNKIIYADWHERDLDWKRAVWTECAELADHIGWKWWSKQKPNMPQARIEVVDITCFLISWVYVACECDMDKTINYFESGLVRPAMSASNPLHVVETFAASVLVNEVVSLPIFRSLMDAVQLDFNGLFVRFLGKVILNRFRQDNGYREGSYKKMWDGQEDNVYLQSIIEGMDSLELDATDKLELIIYRRLDNMYRSIVLNKQVCA